jgi:hypothetical protein
MSLFGKYAGIPSFNIILNWALKFQSIGSVFDSVEIPARCSFVI